MNTKQFLHERQVQHAVVPHRRTYTAQTLAQAVHLSGDTVAKTVLLVVDGRHVLAVLQATHTVDLETVRETLHATSVELAGEDVFADVFPDCEVGALPPFGSQYGMETLVDAELKEAESILFEGNDHEESIQMRYADFEQLEHPMVASFSHHV